MKKTLLVWGSFLTLIFVAILAYSMYCDGTTYTCGNLKEDTDRIFRASIRQILMMVDDTDNSDDSGGDDSGGGDDSSSDDSGGDDSSSDDSGGDDSGGGDDSSSDDSGGDMPTCVSNKDSSCNRNACGGTGVIQCDGSCSAQPPNCDPGVFNCHGFIADHECCCSTFSPVTGCTFDNNDIGGYWIPNECNGEYGKMQGCVRDSSGVYRMVCGNPSTIGCSCSCQASS